MTTVEPAEPGILSAVRREISRNAVRARNGVKYAAGSQFAPAHPTPGDVIWRHGKAHVRHYKSDARRRFQQPVVAYLGLVGRSSIFDLYKGGSIVEMLMNWGFDTYVLDWGVPDESIRRTRSRPTCEGAYPQLSSRSAPRRTATRPTSSPTAWAA
jgi:polyhydroxyalkanoate synthase subunit PhaC